MSRQIGFTISHEADFREGMAELLAEHGFRVVEASDGDQALAFMKAERPALLVTDIAMPRMTGIELVAHMAADPALRDIPFCVISASMHLVFPPGRRLTPPLDQRDQAPSEIGSSDAAGRCEYPAWTTPTVPTCSPWLAASCATRSRPKT